MAPLAFLERMDRPWHWVVLSAIILVVLEITYATLLYSPAIPTVLPLLAGLIFALSYRTPRKTLIPLLALMVFRSYLLLKEMQVPYVWLGTFLIVIRNFTGPFLAAVLYRRQAGTRVISRPSSLIFLFSIVYLVSLILTLPLMYVYQGQLGGIEWIQRSILDVNATSMSVLLFGIFMSRLIIGREIDLHTDRPLAYFGALFVSIMPPVFWVLSPNTYFANRLVLACCLPALLYLGASFPIVWSLLALTLHGLAVVITTNLGLSPLKSDDIMITAVSQHAYMIFVVGSVWMVSLYSRSQRKANHSLELMRAHLEDIVAERTAALEESNRKLHKENEWRSQAEALLKRLTMADPITELPNRVGFIAAFARERNNMLRTHTMIVVSIENFRDISESEGCSAADVIMRQAAALLGEAYPDPSVTARWDDSHFVILTSVPEKSKTNGSILPELLIRLKAMLEQPLALGSYSYSLKTLICATPLSLAWAELDPLEKIILWSSAHFRTMRTDPAIEWAILDAAPEQTSNGIRMQQRLREALDQREFLLYFQPIIAGSMDAVIGCEALIRWQDSKSDRLVMPMAFMPVAERFELIHSLGLWIASEVARQAQLMQEAGLELEFYSLNAAVPQLLHGSFARETLRIWEEAGLRPSLLKVEITESIMAENLPVLAQNLRQLRERGVSIAFDDFGTGYSSLSYLEQFPVDCIKIDRVFVQNLQQRATRSSVVQAIGLLARQLDLQVIVEGVEDQQTIEAIRPIVDVYGWQGYHFARPMAAKDFQKYCREFPELAAPLQTA